MPYFNNIYSSSAFYLISISANMGNTASSAKGRNPFRKFKQSAHVPSNTLVLSKKILKLKIATPDTDSGNTTYESPHSIVNSLAQSRQMTEFNATAKSTRISIFAKSTSAMTKARGTSQSLPHPMLSSIEYQLLSKIISNHFLFKMLSSKALSAFINKLTKRFVKPGVVIYAKESKPECFYIVSSGRFSVVNGCEEEEREVGECETFGEWEMLRNENRKETVVCLDEGVVWSSTRESFIELIQTVRRSEKENMKECLCEELNVNGNEEALLNEMTVCSFEENTLLKQSDIGSDTILLLRKGEISAVNKRGETMKRIAKGMLFNFTGIYHTSLIDCDYLTTSHCELYSLPYTSLRALRGYEHPNDFTSVLLMKCFKESKFFKEIKAEVLMKLVPLFSIRYYSQGTIIFKKAQSIDNSVVILLDGNILNYPHRSVEALQGQILYEKEVYAKSSILLSNNLIASPECLIAIADLSKVKQLMGGTIKEMIDLKAKMKLLKHIPLFDSFTEEKIEDISKKMLSRQYDNQVAILRQGEQAQFFYLIKSGCVDFYNGEQYIKSSYAKAFFGESSVYFNKPFPISAITNGKVELYLLPANAFNQLTTPKMQSYIKKKGSIEDYSIELSDLDYIKALGKGSFGIVNLVQSRKTGEQYAIKAINVNTLKEKNMCSYVEDEKKLLSRLDHPLIMKMVKVFKEEPHIFFLSEYIKGKNLRAILQQGVLSKLQSQLFMASLLASIDYIHSEGVVYRDLKPNNIIITDNGVLKLVDFGIAKAIKCNMTSTVIGTPAYMAPEVIRGQPYGFEVDFWSIGVCLYEFYCGRVPFSDNIKDPVKIYQAVLDEPLTFSSSIHDKDYIKLVSKMLNKSGPRLSTSSEIKKEDWFKAFNWSSFANDLTHVPYKSQTFTENLQRKTIDKGRISYLNYLIGQKTADKSKSNAQLQRINLNATKKWFNEF